MIQISDSERRRAFSIWLRTGRLSGVTVADGVELKFNPWHDPTDGRFTFAGSGRSYGQSGSGGFRGGGGSGGGAGASGDWGDASPMQPQVSRAPATVTKRQARSSTATTGERPSVATTATPFHREIRNDYEYQIDDTGRTRRVSGTLTLTDKQVRSRTAQAQAGGDDRRLTDDGGHYIAARFKGATDAFNHFAQDANFNRGEYRLLEDQWARAKRAGRNVTVKSCRATMARPSAPPPSTSGLQSMATGKVCKFPTRQRRSALPNDKTDRLLGEIGQLLAEDTAYPLDGTLLYARVRSTMVAPSIFKNRGNNIVYREPDLDRLGGALLDLLDAEAPNNRWAEIEYLVQGDTFEVAYAYADEIDPDEDTFDRRDRIVKRYFGDKPIVYPPLSLEEDGIPGYDL